MKIMKNLFVLILASLFMNSCEESESVNTTQSNFDVNFKFTPKVHGEEINLGKYFLLNGPDSIMVERLDFYVESLEIKSITNKKFLTDSIYLFSMTDNITNFRFKNFPIPSSVDTLSFLLGLDDFINHADPNKYPQNHNLSSYKNMSWTWASGYRYIVFEGKIKSGNGAPMSYSFHTGLEYKNMALLFPKKSLAANSTNDIIVNLNIDKIFYPSNGNNVLYNSGERQAHADAVDGVLTDKVAKNFAAAFSIQ